MLHIGSFLQLLIASLIFLFAYLLYPITICSTSISHDNNCELNFINYDVNQLSDLHSIAPNFKNGKYSKCAIHIHQLVNYISLITYMCFNFNFQENQRCARHARRRWKL